MEGELIDKKHLARLLAGLKYTFWPGACMYCSAPLPPSDDWFCQSCWSSLSELCFGDYCPTCGLDTSKYSLIDGKCTRCVSQTLHFDGIARLGRYEDILRDMILNLKQNDAIDVIEPLGQLLKSAITGRIPLEDIDMIVPVPIHWKRKLSRGFNQSTLIAKSLQLGIIRSNPLIRVRPTDYQSGLSHKSRIKNLKNAFKIRSGITVAGKNICLIDDIKTTGTTLNECAKVLKNGGADKVYAAVLAVAGQDERAL